MSFPAPAIGRDRTLQFFGDLAVDPQDVIAVSVLDACSTIVLADGSRLICSVEAGRQLMQYTQEGSNLQPSVP